MHVLQVMSSRGRGGLEQVCVDYTRLLAERGHRVSVLVHPDCPVRDAVVAAGGRVHADALLFRPGARWIPGRTGRWRRFLETAPDVVLLHNARGLANLRAVTKAPLVAVCHNPNFAGKLGLDGAICVSRGIRDALAAECARRGRPMPPTALVPNALPFTADPPPIPERFTGRTVVVGAMGRFVRKKGFDRLLRALAALRDRGQPVRCVIAGDGEEGQALRDLAARLGLQDTASFAGWVGDKAAFFREADVFCLPSTDEPFGIVMTEAMYFGCPVVAGDGDGPRDIADVPGVAVLYDRHSDAALTEALAAAIADPAGSRAMAARGQAHVLSRYRPQRVGDLLERALQDRLAK